MRWRSFSNSCAQRPCARRSAFPLAFPTPPARARSALEAYDCPPRPRLLLLCDSCSSTACSRAGSTLCKSTLRPPRWDFSLSPLCRLRPRETLRTFEFCSARFTEDGPRCFASRRSTRRSYARECGMRLDDAGRLPLAVASSALF